MLPLPQSPPNLRERVAIVEECDRDARFREAVKAKCMEDAAWFISAFGWTADPREDATETDIPFILYPFQIDHIHWMDELLERGESGLLEKSRDMGITWDSIAWFAHKWLFRPGFQGLLGSRKEDYVDNWKLASLFGKLEYFLKKLPGWLLPVGFNFKKHRRKLALTNPENGNVIEGESSNPNFSRAGRYTAILMDEAAFWPDLEAALRAASQSSKVRFIVSTPEGMNSFGRLRYSGKIKVLTIHWTLHPHKTQDWYAKETSEMSDEDIAQELDISYSRSVHGVVYPGWQNVPKGHYPWHDKLTVYLSMDFGIADDTAMIWWGRDPETGKVRMIDSFAYRNKPADFYVPLILGHFPTLDHEGKPFKHKPSDYPLEALEKISEHSLWPFPVCYGDPAGNQRSQATGDTVISIFAKYGIFFVTNPAMNNFRARKNRTDVRLREMEGVHLETCAAVDEAMLNARFPTRSSDSRSTKPVTLPVHDKTTSHFRTAVEYFWINLPSLNRRRRPENTRREMAYDKLTAPRRR